MVCLVLDLVLLRIYRPKKAVSMLLGHLGLKLEFYSNTNFRKPTKTWILNNAHLNHQWVKKEIKELNTSLNSSKWLQNLPNLTGHSKSIVKKKVHNTKCLHKEARKISHTCELTEHIRAPEQKEANLMWDSPLYAVITIG